MSGIASITHSYVKEIPQGHSTRIVDTRKNAPGLRAIDTPLVIEAVRRAKGKVTIEASGNVSLERIGEIARAGVDYISVGALTHSVKAAYIGLDFL